MSNFTALYKRLVYYKQHSLYVSLSLSLSLLSVCLSVCFSLSLSYTHTHTHTHTIAIVLHTFLLQCWFNICFKLETTTSRETRERDRQTDRQTEKQTDRQLYVTKDHEQYTTQHIIYRIVKNKTQESLTRITSAGNTQCQGRQRVVEE